MSLFDGLRHRIHVLRRGDDYARDTERELRLHVELAALERAGASPSDIAAERQARLDLGNATYYREEVRRMTWQSWIDRVRQNTSYAFRGLKRTPSFTAAVVLTLGFGVGVNAALFSLIDRVFLQQPSGVVDPDGLRRLYIETTYGASIAAIRAAPNMQYAQWRALRSAVGPNVRLGAFSPPDTVQIKNGDAVVPARQSLVNSDYFALAGVRAQAGRLLSPDEDDIATPTRVAILSDAFWRRAFGADRSIIGKRVTIGTGQFTVIGIAPPGFTGLDIDAVDVWSPMNTYQGTSVTGGPWYETLGASFQAVVRPSSPSELERMTVAGTHAVDAVRIKFFAHWPSRILAASIIEARGPGDRDTQLTVTTRMAVFALLVLLIACANVTNLMLLRGSGRAREIAVRRALGASRGRLVEQLTVESLVLAVGASVIALGLAAWAGAGLRQLILPRVQWAGSILDWRTAAFTFAICTVVGLVAGLAPAFTAMTPDLTSSLKAGMRNGAYRGSIARAVLLGVQAALCLVLLVGSGLFIRSLENVESIQLGFDPANQFFYQPWFSSLYAHDAELRTAFPEAARRLSAVDGVEAIAYATSGISTYSGRRPIFVPGGESSPSPSATTPGMISVSSGFFNASGLAVRSGREFADGDGAAGELVVIVNEMMAKRYWPGTSALGQCFAIGQADAPCRRIVGIVADAHSGVFESPTAQFYLPVAQWTDAPRVMMARVRPGRAPAVARAMEDILRPLVTGLVGLMARPVAYSREIELRPWRIGATLVGAIGLLALIVAAVGIYSVVAYDASQRTHEMGIRVALGAQSREILDLVLRGGFAVIAGGMTAGAVIVLALGRLVSSMLFGVVASDVSVLMGGIALLTGIALIACLLPGLRAARVDPVIALRAD